MSRLILPGQKPIIGIADEIKHALIAWHGSNPYTNLSNHPDIIYKSGGQGWNVLTDSGPGIKATSYTDHNFLDFGGLNPSSYGYTNGFSVFADITKLSNPSGGTHPAILRAGKSTSEVVGLCLLSFETATPNASNIGIRVGDNSTFVDLYSGKLDDVTTIILSIGDRVRVGAYWDDVGNTLTTYFKLNDNPVITYSRSISAFVENAVSNISIGGYYRSGNRASDAHSINSVVLVPHGPNRGDPLRVLDWVENPDQLWVTSKSLYIPQQADWETNLSGNNVSQSNKSTQGQIAQSNSLVGDNVAQRNKSTGGSISSQNDLIGWDASQSNLSAQGQITSAGSLSGADVEQENKSSEGAVETSIYLLGNSVDQQNYSTAGGVEVSGTLAGSDVIQNNKSTAGQIAVAGSLFGDNVLQGNTSSQGAITATGALTGANCQQENTSSQGSIVAIPGLVGDDVAQDNLSTHGAITAAWELSGSNVISINRSSAGQIPYTEAWLSGDDCQQVNKSTQGAVSEGMLLFGDNVIQGNFSSRGSVNVTDILDNADVEGKIWMALKRHIEAI